LIVISMASAFAIVCLIEWLSAREQRSFLRPHGAAPAHPVVEAQRVEDTDEHDSLGWTAFEEAQEPSDAMTIIGAPPREEEPPAETAPDPEPKPELESDPEPEPDEPELPPAAKEEGGPSSESRSWWRRHRDGEDSSPEQEPPPRHVRVLPAAEEPPRSDPWEKGFDGPETLRDSGEPELVEDDAPRRFRRR
jgi:hypothetical protein